MSLNHQELEEIWRKQEAVLPNKPVGAWLFPIVLILPLLTAKFSPGAVRGCAIAGGAYLLYGIITHLAWRLWSRSNKKATVQKRITALLVAGYSGLSLLFLSMIFLSTALLGTRYLSFGGDTVAIAIMAIYLAGAIFVLARAAHFLRNALNKPVNPATQPEMQWALGIQSALVGVGVLLGIIFARSSYASIVGVGMATVGAFLFLPLGVVALYAVIILAWDWFLGHGKSTGHSNCRSRSQQG